ncbi:hypothetical protein MSG28_005268 [Choristoneura fumiferana]|uniref:Uncharacterized protein n=1 Tax=Choristoneura fumiferana TaxID=7141 RepID=A0ACC0JQJ4_CHOFU|nr:hypothetical protein MSG28_005268 [Choristoneura fumiferana]
MAGKRHLVSKRTEDLLRCGVCGRSFFLSLHHRTPKRRVKDKQLWPERPNYWTHVKDYFEPATGVSFHTELRYKGSHLVDHHAIAAKILGRGDPTSKHDPVSGQKEAQYRTPKYDAEVRKPSRFQYIGASSATETPRLET